ncbi:MAG: hypothetical protein ACTHKQ_20210 [Mesorhizobium sp.]
MGIQLRRRLVWRIIAGMFASGLTFGIGQLLLGTVRPLWTKLMITLLFVAPAAVTGCHATHGIAKHLIPSDAWQIAFSIFGAVGVAAFIRITGAASTGQSRQGIARA